MKETGTKKKWRKEIAHRKMIAPLVSWHSYASIKYPYQKIVERSGVEYFTSSLAYMLAYAWYLGEFDTIKLFGVDISNDTEYRDHKPCLEHWIGRLMEQGAEFIFGITSQLLLPHGNGRQYGEPGTK